MSTSQYVPCFKEYFCYMLSLCRKDTLDVLGGVKTAQQAADYDSSSKQSKYLEIEHNFIKQVLDTSHVHVFGFEGIFQDFFCLGLFVN